MRQTIRKGQLAAASALLIFGGAHAQDARTLSTYVGHYELAPGLVMVVSYEAGHLYAQLTDQDRFEGCCQSNRNLSPPVGLPAGEGEARP